MKAVTRHPGLWAIVIGLIAGTATLAQSGRPWKSITAEQLLEPGTGDWVSYRRTNDVTAFSPLRQIDRTTVRQLRPVWSYSRWTLLSSR